MEIGPFSTELGIHEGNFITKLEALDKSKVTKGLILEIYHYVISSQCKTATFGDFYRAIKTFYDIDYLPESTLRSNIASIKKEYKRKKKNVATPEQLEAPKLYLREVYQPPKNRKRKIGTPVATPRPSKIMKAEPEDAEPEDSLRTLKKENQILKKANDKLTEENRKLKQKLTASQANLKRVYTLVGKHCKTTKGFLQTQKRRKVAVGRWKKKAKEERVRRKKLEKRKETSKVIPRVSVTAATDALSSTIVRLRQEEETTRFLENEVLMLKEKNEDKGEINTKLDGTRINPKLKEASMYLQNMGLAEHKCSEAIKLTVEAVTDHELKGRLPSRSSQGRIASEMKALAVKKVVENTRGQTNMTLKYDGTTDRRGRHITEVEVATEADTFLIGIRPQPSATAAEYAKTITDSLSDIDKSADLEGSEKLLANISNTMTDRCATNNAVDRKLEEIKGKALNRFRCAMHPLDSMQKACEKVLQSKEKELGTKNKYTDNPFRRRGESGTHALLRVIDKLFHDASVAIGPDLSNYLQQNGFQSESKNDEKVTMYLRWVGNKFNLLFKNATYAVNYTPHIITFLTKINQSRNSAALAALNVLRGGDCHIQLKCLGLINKYITGPWQTIVSQSMNILDMNELFQKGHQQITTWIEDPSPLFSGCSEDCFGGTVKQEDVFLKKVQGEDLGNKEEARELLSAMLQAIIDLIDRQLADQLPGGKFWEPTEELREQAKSCESHNISGERKFAKMKAQQSRAPSMSMEKIEQKEMFDVNKVKASMLKKSKEERMKDVMWATREGAKIRKEDMKRGRLYKDRMRARLEESKKALSEKEQKSRDDLDGIVEEVCQYGGLWMKPEEIEVNTSKLSNTKMKDALKAQIKFRLNILQCKVEKKIFYSKTPIAEMKAYLKYLLSDVEIPEDTLFLQEVILSPETLLQSRIIQRFEDDQTGVETEWKGTITKAVENEYGVKEFEFVYDDELDKPCYETVGELVADMVSGDLRMA